MKIPALLIAVLIQAVCLVSPVAGQVASATVGGVVLEAGGRIAIEGAEITVVGTRLRSMSSALGEFRFAEVEPGLVVLRATHPGYLTRTDTIAVAPRERVEVRLTLGVEAIELEPITVVTRRGTLGTGLTGQFPGMTRAEIDAVLPRTQNLADLIQAGNFAGLRIVERVSALGSTCVEHGRARSGRFGQDICVTMNVFVDGRPVFDPGETFATMAPETIERLEILSPLDASTVYGGAGSRGLVLIETRSGSGVTQRSLPAYSRDLAPITVAIAFTLGSPADLYDGPAVFTYQQNVTPIVYLEQSRSRPGLRAAVRTRTLGWFPQIEVSGLFVTGESEATFLDGLGGIVTEQHDFNTVAFDITARPRLINREKWDLSFLVGPVFAWESLTANTAATFPGAPGLGEIVSRHMTRTWSTVGLVVGAEFEWVLGSRSSLLFGGRWRALTLGSEGEFITERDALAGEDRINLPQASRRSGRRSFDIGYVLRLGG